jgi:hypothetical protein
MDVDRHHKLAVLAHQRGEGSKWVTAYHSSKLVGRKTPGLTLSLARDLALSVDAVEHMAKAYVTYDILKTAERLDQIVVQSLEWPSMRKLRERLTIKHFAILGRLMFRYEFSLQQAVSYLEWAAEDGASVESMRRLILDGEGEDQSGEWERELTLLTRKAANLLNTYQIPEDLRLIVANFLSSTTKWVEEHEA